MANTSATITVYMASDMVALPCGVTETAPFLELLWRATGADCDGEEEDMKCGCGNVHSFLLKDGVEEGVPPPKRAPPKVAKAYAPGTVAHLVTHLENCGAEHGAREWSALKAHLAEHADRLFYGATSH
jgi:hypothetical protein